MKLILAETPKTELIALLNLSSWCLVRVERLFLAVPRGCLQFVIVVFPDHTHLLFFLTTRLKYGSRTFGQQFYLLNNTNTVNSLNFFIHYTWFVKVDIILCKYQHRHAQVIHKRYI